MKDIIKLFQSIFLIGLFIVLYLFFSLNPLVSYTLFILSFIVTITLRKYRKHLKINEIQSDAYRFINTGIVLGIGLCLFMGLGKQDTVQLYFYNHIFYGYLFAAITIIIGLLNIAYGADINERV